MPADKPQPQAHRPLIPPPWFVQRYNERNPGQYRTAIDPHVMFCWHMVTAWEHKPIDLRLISGV